MPRMKPEWMAKVVGQTIRDVFTMPKNEDVTVFVFDTGRLTHSFSPGGSYSEYTQDDPYSEWSWQDVP